MFPCEEKPLSKCPSSTYQAYLAPCVTLAYSQPCHILSPSLFRTKGLFKTCETLTRHIQNPTVSHIALQPCATLAYVETCYTQNSGIFRTLP